MIISIKGFPLVGSLHEEIRNSILPLEDKPQTCLEDPSKKTENSHTQKKLISEILWEKRAEADTL